MELTKVILAFALLLALSSCKEIEVTFNNTLCRVDGISDGAILMKGNNKLTITLEANTSCFTATAYVTVERRSRAIGVKVNEYYTEGKLTKDVKWEHQVLVDYYGYGTN